MDLDTAVNRADLINVYPDLAGDANFKILSEPTDVYNCIAWAMGYKDRWVDFNEAPGHWWPEGVEKSLKCQALIDAFAAEGFELAEDCVPEDGYDKVVLYKYEDFGLWAHASRVLSAEIEHSKFGESWDGQHSHNVLCKTVIGRENDSYGVSFAFMKRRVVKGAVTTVEARGDMTVDVNKLAKAKAQLAKVRF